MPPPPAILFNAKFFLFERKSDHLGANLRKLCMISILLEYRLVCLTSVLSNLFCIKKY